MEEREYRYWFSRLEAVPVRLRRELLGLLGSPEALYKEKQWPVSPALLRAVEKSRAEELLWRRELEELPQKGLHWVWWEEEDYPARLRELPDAPLGLWYRGRLPGNEPAVGIVGARACSEYGRSMAEHFGRELGRAGLPVISGMALGIDSAAQEAALDAGGCSFAVLGSGADVCYPASKRRLYDRLAEAGGVLSELPPESVALPFHFPERNRIISGLSRVLLVLEARQKSGSLITVDQALEQGRDVLALPGRVGDELSRGCLELLRQGAGLLLDMSSVYSALGMAGPQSDEDGEPAPPLTGREEAVLALLDSTPRHVEELMKAGGFSMGELSLLLLGLEGKGLVRSVTAGQYVRR